MNLQKCAVIGTGFVGATAAYTLATSGLFSELILLDVNRTKAEGEAADISHGVSFAQPCAVHAGDYQDLKDCGLVILAAGANQKPGETRIDLLHRNEVILKSILDAVLSVAPDCILLVVSNPVDLLTYLAQKLSGLPACRVIGTGTVLDTARLKYLVGQYLQVDSRNIHAFIIGEHGDSELAVWSSANVSGMDLPDYCRIAVRNFRSRCWTTSIKTCVTRPTTSLRAKARPITASAWRYCASHAPSCAVSAQCSRYPQLFRVGTAWTKSAWVCHRSWVKTASRPYSICRSATRSASGWSPQPPSCAPCSMK